ncbi:MAG: O-methyltransferase [Candidatus Binataceae bacterium]
MDRIETEAAPRAETVERRIEEIHQSGMVLGDDDRGYSILPMSVTPARGGFISDICRACKPEKTLEVGMAWGLSTLHILKAMIEIGSARPGCHVVMDPYQSSTFHNAALRTIRDAGLGALIEFHGEASELTLPRLAEEGRQFDLAFIDGDHRYDAVFIDFFFVHRLLKPGGIVIFDDPGFDGVFLTCQFAETNYGYTVEAEYPNRVGARLSGRRRSRKRHLLERPSIRAYRKPAAEPARDHLHFTPFFNGFVTRDRLPRLDPRRIERNRQSHAGLRALGEGDVIAARRAFISAMRAAPLYPQTYLRIIRTYLPIGIAARLSGRTVRGR